MVGEDTGIVLGLWMTNKSLKKKKEEEEGRKAQNESLLVLSLTETETLTEIWIHCGKTAND